MYPKEISDVKERFFRQCYETLFNSYKEINYGDTLNSFNRSISHNGFSPALTTRPESCKTGVIVVVNRK